MTLQVSVGTQIRFFESGAFSPADAGTNWTIGTPTDVALELATTANAAGRQSDKVDLGATRSSTYEVLGCIDFTGETPTVGSTVGYYWAPSTSATAANGNVAGNSGVEAAAPNGALGGIVMSEFVNLCQYIGSLTVHDGGSVQSGLVGVFAPSSRYGQLIIYNNSGDIFEGDNVEMHQVFNPIDLADA